MYTQIKKENFKETIKKELMSRIKGAKLYENNVVKNNVTKLGIVVNRANENISPTFYIDDLYNMYLENNSIDEVVDFIFCFLCSYTTFFRMPTSTRFYFTIWINKTVFSNSFNIST